MHLFKTSGQTYASVIKNQKHAFRGRPGNLVKDDIILVSKNKKDCAPNERQIAYTMRLQEIRPTSDAEIELYWPGNKGRWDHIVDCYGTEPIPAPFNLNEVLGKGVKNYDAAQTHAKLKKEHEALILPLLTLPSSNTTGELPPSHQYQEGAVRSIIVNAYERDPAARAACLAHFGLSCRACGFNFQDTYGQLGAGYIHVHHIIPLADIGERYKVNPVADLIPLCANCHAMIHRRRPTLTMPELIAQLHGEVG